MENLLLDATKVPKFVVKVRVKEMRQQSMESMELFGNSTEDKHACKILGITSKENHQRYWVTKANTQNCHTFEKTDWLVEYPTGLPQCTLLNEDNRRFNLEVHKQH
jgi:hypothetical protein